MNRNLTTIIFLFLFSIGSLFAQDKVTHKVEAGQTLFFIAKKYNTSIDEIRALNPEIGEDLIIRPEQVIFVKSNIVTNTSTDRPNEEYKIHIVESKETLYSLSKKYNLTVDELIQMNDLAAPSIQIGQELKVKKLSVNQEALFSNEEIETPVEDVEILTPAINTTPIESSTPVEELPEIEDGDSDLYKTLFDAYSGEQLNKDKGVANFLAQGSDDAYLALINGVPKNQVLKVRNLMNNKVVYLKVVGELPENETKNNVSLKVSKAAAEKLNVIEERFLAEWSWYNIDLSSPSVEEKEEFEYVPYDDF